MEKISKSEEETIDVAIRFAESLEAGQLVCLHGNLGAGKTVFARGVARGLGITEALCSPTFTIVQEYQGTDVRLYHIDLYRLQDSHDALSFGIENYIQDPAAVTLIEWAERIPDLLNDKSRHVYLEHIPEGRRIRIPELTE